MGTKNNPGQFDCYDAAEDDEPMFTLLARDPMAPSLVRTWAEARRQRGRSQRDIDKADEAEQCAAAMERWQSDHPDH